MNSLEETTDVNDLLDKIKVLESTIKKILKRLELIEEHINDDIFPFE